MDIVNAACLGFMSWLDVAMEELSLMNGSCLSRSNRSRSVPS
jgi:hypothetical protein